MNLSFKTNLPWDEAKKTNFVAKILSGEKIHSIRDDKHDKWKVGNKIHFCINMRTKAYQQFKVDICKSIQKISIKYETVFEPVIIIDERKLKFSEFESLAKNDGFNSVMDFLIWFDKDFEGKIIHWTDFKY